MVMLGCCLPQLAMSFVDDLVGGAVTALAGDKAQALNDFLSSNGGVSGLTQKFQNGGAGEIFASWVSSDENQKISADMINQVMGTEQVQALAQKMGVDPAQASSFVAEHLPQLIDQLTPTGQAPAADSGAQG